MISTSDPIQIDHPLVSTEEFGTPEGIVLVLMDRKAYEEAGELAAGKTVLDWGCNDGYGLELMKARVSSVAGLDSAPHCIEAAQDRLPDVADSIRLYDGGIVPF